MPNRNAEGNQGSTPIDAWFDVLNDPRRRFLCRYMLRTEADIVTHEDLIDFIIECDSNLADEVSDRQSVAMELRHVHLPKLDSTEAVDYEPRKEQVSIDSSTLLANLENVQSTVEDIQQADR
ncbi:hypothetical protein ACFR99_08635 [Haloarchaeobius amylolyticus]|uniref:DUF7344 domain-containing protein n=1 Tax=Haloarchaeobius amylolyticus TaxID=1198296 RepID=A0ABD6BF05_9EURY